MHFVSSSLVGKTVLPFVLLFLLAGCDVDVPGAHGDSSVSRVLISGTELLTPPIIGNQRVYTRDHSFTCGSEGQNCSDFRLTVKTTCPEELKIRLVDEDLGVSAQLTRVNGTGVDEQGVSATELPDEASTALARGEGVFWIVQGENAGLDYEVVLVIPDELFGPFNRLDAFVSQTSDGSPLRGDSIDLVNGFFYLAALGDSAMWGNGLREQDKFSYLVAQTIQQETGLKVIRRVSAISGSSIIPVEEDYVCRVKCTGEVPTVRTSITLQAQSMPFPDQMDLILLDGCGNDVTLTKILSPLTTTEDLEERTERFCQGEMINLLVLVRSLAPNTPIVVTGYFPFVSLDSGAEEVGQFAQTQNLPGADNDGQDDILIAMAANSETFYSKSRHHLAIAVETASAMTEYLSPIVFADTQFDPENSTFAPEAWLWGVTTGESVLEQLGVDWELVPEDPLFQYRLSACLEDEVLPDPISCVYASIAHPNPEGANAYTTEIVGKLREIGVLAPIDDEE